MTNITNTSLLPFPRPEKEGERNRNERDVRKLELKVSENSIAGKKGIGD